MQSGVIETDENMSYGRISVKRKSYSTTNAAPPASVVGLASKNSALDHYEEISLVAKGHHPV